MSEATLTTGEVITIAEGYLACDMEQIYNALNTLLGDSLMTHQLPRAASFVEPYLREDFDWLNDLPARPNIEGMDKEEIKTTILKWLSDISAEHGELHKVPDLSGQWIHLNPIDELIAIRGGSTEGIIVVNIEDES